MHKSNRTKLTGKILVAENISFEMRRLVIGGNDLKSIFDHPDILEPGAWVKLFPPGISGRAYTLRSVDLVNQTLTIDFVIHGEDPLTVSSWAKDVEVGTELELAGPRSGGFDLLPSTQQLWIAVDTTALPAALSIIESLPHEIIVKVLFIVPDNSNKPLIISKASVEAYWLNEYPKCEKKYIENIKLDSSLQIWIAGEASWAKAWKMYWINQLNFDSKQITTKGYWKSGELDYRD
ncbi:siderophore-interacting protein [Acinetobacter oleivorans]|uniref:siderophore-interacting protein n=1 Tax=Acinetobacter TaxID=469 RepID=UPI000DD00D3C|nr:SIP domain-containing protein [Acinetobacter oleivorans]MDV7644938.1 SIP domain-containing protein [Acinetobacter baumannii]